MDVPTGKVTIVQPKGGASGSRGVFTGTTVGFNSSVLLDQAGLPGLKTLSVSLTNHWSLPLGVDPKGAATGVRLIFSNFFNPGQIVDLRETTHVSTIAGTGVASGVNGPVGNATFANPIGTAVDSNGAVYVADISDNLVRKIQGGLVTTLAGNATAGGANGLGTAASFTGPFGVAVSPTDGAIYVTEFNGHRIRRISPDGRTSTVAGNGTAGVADGLGNASTFNNPAGIVVDANGVIYVAEFGGEHIRKIQLTGPDPRAATSYTVSTLAGSGAIGSADGNGAAATFQHPVGITVGKDGALFTCDQSNNKIRKISLTGEVLTIAGTGVAGSADGPGNVASINSPRGIVAVNGALIVTEQNGNRLRQITLRADGGGSPSSADGYQVATLAGTGAAGSQDGSGSNATFTQPQLLASDGAGNLYVPGLDNKIRKVVPTSGTFPIGLPNGNVIAEQVQISNEDGVLPIAGVPGGVPYIRYAQTVAPGETSSSQNWNFVVPSGVSSFDFTVTVEADTTALTPPEGSSGIGSANVDVRTYAGSSTIGYVDGILSIARFNGPEILTVDAAGDVYISDNFNGLIRRISKDGIVSTIAGQLSGGSTDGPGNAAKFSTPEGIAVSPDGNTVYVADTGNHKIRRITFQGGDIMNSANWLVTTIVGTGSLGGNYSQLPGNTATLNTPIGLVMDGGGNLYVSEYNGNRIRRVQFLGGNPSQASSWNCTLVAGDSSVVAPTGANTDSNSGFGARFNHPAMLAIDSSGRIYVADSTNSRIRVVTTDGATSTLAGGISGDTPVSAYADGPGATAHFQNPFAIAIDQAGLIYVGDSTGERIRQITQGGNVTTIAGTGTGGDKDGRGNIATFREPESIAVLPSGALLVGEVNNNSIRIIQRVISNGTH